ncbi:hypothetical protein [Plesiomonas shigelloides]|uniref:hypothetical protein n=1 Tax=Plesiomonas shigelloides TaxID=703 RepID=UPI001261C663|nr:hypothetical protein [Plesiomonas shigelloides]KAB7661748.1 hypothetical protein GBN25_14365 [Plesiomonas shigelloides]
MYNSSHLFSSFIKYGEQVDYQSDIQLYNYVLDEEFSECRDPENLARALKEVNSTCKVEIRSGKIFLEFEAGSDSWGKEFRGYFYETLENFIKTCSRKKSVPAKFCIVDRKLTEQDQDDALLNKIILIIKWVSLLYDMADHVQNDNNVFVFFVHHKEGKTKPYQIIPYLDIPVIESLDLDCDIARYERLYSSWHLEDAQKKDRQSVMLASFAEIMASIDDNENTFEVFLSNTKKFHDRYSENYEIYVNRFTVDSQLREIDEQHLGFVGKLQELVTSSQTKAFALPGVMVAIGALAKADNILGIIVILVGAIMTKSLITKSNEFLSENLDHFKDTFDRALGHYVKSRVDAEEVISHAKAAQDKLDSQLEKARSRIEFIDSMSKWMLWISIFLAVFVFYNITKKNYSEELLTAFNWVAGAGDFIFEWFSKIFHK